MDAKLKVIMSFYFYLFIVSLLSRFFTNACSAQITDISLHNHSDANF